MVRSHDSICKEAEVRAALGPPLPALPTARPPAFIFNAPREVRREVARRPGGRRPLTPFRPPAALHGDGRRRGCRSPGPSALRRRAAARLLTSAPRAAREDGFDGVPALLQPAVPAAEE